MAMAVPCCLPLFLPPVPAPVSAPAPAQEVPVHVPVLGDEDEDRRAGHATWGFHPRIGQLPLTKGVRVTATHATHTATEEAEEEGVPAAQARPEVRLPGQSTEHLVEAQGGEGKRGERKAGKDWETNATPTGTASGTGDIPAHAVAASSDVPAAARLPLGSDANAIGNGVSSVKGAEPRAHVVGDNDTTTGSKEATDDEQGTTKTHPKQAKQDGPLTATTIGGPALVC